MASDISVLVSGIDYKIQKLIKLLEVALEEKNQLLEKNRELANIVKAQAEKINNVEEQKKLLKIANSIETAEGKTEVKLKINELVREIDNCIALLNR